MLIKTCLRLMIYKLKIIDIIQQYFRSCKLIHNLQIINYTILNEYLKYDLQLIYQDQIIRYIYIQYQKLSLPFVFQIQMQNFYYKFLNLMQQNQNNCPSSDIISYTDCLNQTKELNTILQDHYNRLINSQKFCQKLFSEDCTNDCKDIHIQKSLFSENTLKKINVSNLCRSLNCQDNDGEHKANKYHFSKNHKDKILTNIYNELKLTYCFLSYNKNLEYTDINFNQYMQNTQEDKQNYSIGNNILKKRKYKDKQKSKTTFIKSQKNPIDIERNADGTTRISENQIWTEIRLLNYLKKNHCENVIQIQGVRIQGKNISMVIQGGEQSLYKIISTRKIDHKPFTQNEIFNIFKSILNGLQYIHEHWYHLDIKPHNIVKCFNYNAKSNHSNEIWKIIDFQCAREKSKTIYFAIGTNSYQAPELEDHFQKINKQRQNCLKMKIAFDEKNTGFKLSGKQDIYSLGVTMYQVITLNKQYDRDSSKFTPKDKENKSDQMLGFIASVEQMLRIDPEQRPSLKKLKSQSFIAKDAQKSYINNHLVFCLDTSGSMDENPWQCVIKAFKNFKEKRKDRAFDRVSVILFNQKAYLKCEMKKWDDINIKDTLQYIGGNTDFSNALKQSREILKRNWNSVQKSSLIFMSDGICENGKSEAQIIYKQFNQSGKLIKAAFLACGNDAKQSKLQELSDIFQDHGTFYTCKSNEQIVKYFEYISVLMS